MIRAGGAIDTVISCCFSRGLTLRGAGIDVRRGFKVVEDASCNFLGVPVRLKSSFDGRGNRDLVFSGEFLADEGRGRNWALFDEREAIFAVCFSPKAWDVGVKPV